MADATSGKKKALSNFFAKKPKEATHAAPVPAPAPAPAASAAAGSGSLVSDIAASGDWADEAAAPAAALEPTVAAKMKARVGDLTEEDMEAYLGGAQNQDQVDIDAEDAKRALWGARKNVAKKKAAAPAGAAAPTMQSTWRARLAARAGGASLSGGKVDTSNAFMFPGLGASAAGPAGPRTVAPDAGIVDGFKHKNAWAALAVDDEEDVEEAEAAAIAPVAAPAAGKAAATPAAAAAAAAAADPASVTEADLVQGPPSAPLCTSQADVEAVVEKILNELRTSCDVGEALRRLGGELRVAEPGLREKAVEAAIQRGMDAETAAARLDIGRVLARLVLPARVVTLPQLLRAVGAFMAVFDDLVTDYPRAAAYFADILGGLHAARLLPVAALPPPVAAALGVAAAPAAVAAAAPADVPVAAAPSAAAAASAEAKQEVPDESAEAPAGEPGDAAPKKRKKKAALVFDE